MLGTIKNWVKKLVGTAETEEKVRGLYYKTEADKAQLRAEIEKTREENLFATGTLLVKNLKQGPEPKQLADSEFKVFSQYGEDGIIQYLIHKIPEIPKSFIEFGVESYVEANTRFLLMHDSWRGLIIDGSDSNMELVRKSDLYWKHELKAVSAFITRENINRLFEENGFTGDIGILSIDIDGNDYWVWESINTVNPAIVVVEYNANLGCEKAISVPYNPEFVRSAAHYSFLYFGASLPAFYHLASKKGYAFLGCNLAGNNAFFVRNDYASRFRIAGLKEGFVRGQARETRDENGQLTFAGEAERKAILENLPYVEVYQGLLKK
jgi:hypothetical protein